MKIADIICENIGHDGDKHFVMTGPQMQEARNPKSRSALVYMSPAEFLSLIPKSFNPEKLENTRQLAQQGVPYRDIPQLNFMHNGNGEATVFDHEGRHRSQALHELGIQQIPVILRSLGNRNGPEIRWGSQDNKFDKIPVMPKILHGEDGRASIPFPQNVFFPMSETKIPQTKNRQNPGVNRSSGKMPGKVAGSGKALKVKPGFVG